ncbi:MAG: hypothetical protein ACLQAT_20670 [Candidatus Binataceae bacterium]
MARQNLSAAGVYFCDHGLRAYLYTSPDEFPVLYDFSLGHWLYYVSGTSRQFYDFTTNRFFSSPPG